MSDGTRATKSRMSFAGTMSELREIEEARIALSTNLTQRISMAFSPGTTPQMDKLNKPRRRSVPSAYPNLSPQLSPDSGQRQDLILSPELVDLKPNPTEIGIGRKSGNHIADRKSGNHVNSSKGEATDEQRRSDFSDDEEEKSVISIDM